MLRIAGVIEFVRAQIGLVFHAASHFEAGLTDRFKNAVLAAAVMESR